MSFLPSSICPITIVGGGPIGLLFSLLFMRMLEKKGSILSFPSIRIIEKSSLKNLSSPDPDGRTVALTYRTVQLLKEIDLWSFLEKEAEPILDILVTEGKDHEGVHYNHRSVGEPLGYIVENYLLKKVLFKAVRAHQNIKILSDTSLENIEEHDAFLSLSLSDETSLKTQILIGADGRTSKVRALRNFDSYEVPYSQQALVCRIGHYYPHQGWALESFFPEGPFATLPLRGTKEWPYQSGLVWCESVEKSKPLSFCTTEEFEDALSQKWNADRFGMPTLISERWVYPLSATLVPSFIKPRTVLLGDAAHGVHPVAGQGLNLGIKDVIRLSEKMAEAIYLGLDAGSSTFLKSYERGRRFDSMSLFAVTHGMIRLFERKERSIAFLRKNALRAVDHIAPLKKAFMYEAMGLSVLSRKPGIKVEP